MRYAGVVAGLGWFAFAAAQEFVSYPDVDNTVSSKIFDGAEISYKETHFCETTKGVKSYSGYVKLPKKVLDDTEGWTDDQSVNLFFWYFEARNNPSTAPTSFYLGGGPGHTSFDGTSDFPCQVNPDSNSTTLNELSWNNDVNMLYIDQPAAVGFSFLSLVNGTLDFLTPQFTPVKSQDDLPELNVTTVAATLDITAQTSDLKKAGLAPRTTMSAARTMWKVLQVWMNEFPERKTNNDELSLWTSSYGGFYGPTFFSHFIDQNDLIKKGKPPVPKAKTLNLGTLGLLDACVDSKIMAESYPLQAYKNTFGIQAYSKKIFDETMALVTAPKEGCHALVDRCRDLSEAGDPQNFGFNETVNKACLVATDVCFNKIQGALGEASDRNPFDITISNITSVPEDYRPAFFNQPWVQKELGVPVNFTTDSSAVQRGFFSITGDPMVRSKSALEHVLESGVNVAMAYGDRDARCPWFGGEDVSLALEFSDADKFRGAGYQSIFTNSSYDGGFVRQSGNLSFSRIFQSGHGVAAYQPETMYHVFERAMSRHDVATGKVDLAKRTDFVSDGPSSVRNVTNKVPEAELSTCYVYQAPIACTNEQLAALAEGSAVVKDWIVVKPEGTRGEFAKDNEDDSDDSKGDSDGDSKPKSSGASTKSVTKAALLVAVAMGLMY